MNSHPYGGKHHHLVRVEFQDVPSFEITSPCDIGPIWCIGTTNIVPEGDFIRWEFDFVCGHAKFALTCARLVIESDFVRREGRYPERACQRPRS